MKNKILSVGLTALIAISMIPSGVHANDYGGWFNSFAPVDCFIIDNLPSIGHQVKVIYSDDVAKQIGRDSVIAESGKCYDSSSALLILNGDEQSMYSGGDVYQKSFRAVGESLFGKFGTYLDYQDVGVPYEMFFQEGINLKPVLDTIDQDFGRCDKRKRIETHITIREVSVVEQGDGHPMENGSVTPGKEIWLLKNGTRMDAPVFNFGYAEESKWSTTLARDIGCYDVLQTYLGGKTDQLIKEHVDGIPPTKEVVSPEDMEEVKDQLIIQSVGDASQEKEPFQWWWALAGAAVIGGVIIARKKFHK